MVKQRTQVTSVLMQGGQGDVVMAANGLQALLELGVPVLAPDAVCYTRSFVSPLIRIMLPQVRVSVLSESKHCAHPRYATSSKTSWTTVYRNYFTRDYYVNFAERRRLASYGYESPTRMRRLQQWLTDRRLASGPRPLRETPAYYGLKMWAPLAEAWSVSEIELLRGLYLSHHTISDRLASYARALPDAGSKKIAFFPGGSAFQFLPPSFLARVRDELGLGARDYSCYFAPHDESIDDYRASNLACGITDSLDDLLSVMVRSTVTITADSFASHVAQLVSRRHLALMSHDLPEHTLHPAAGSVAVFEPLQCCPCDYTHRSTKKVCPAGKPVCGAFVSDGYAERAVRALRQLLPL